LKVIKNGSVFNIHDLEVYFINNINFRLRHMYVIGGWRNLHEELFTKYNYNDEVNEGEMGRGGITHGSEEECIQGSGGKIRPSSS
jgi:hypothetical protein